jgi:hypothetical protein
VSSVDGSAAGQLGVKYEGGQQIGYFTFDGSRQSNLRGEAVATATSVTGTFPLDQLTRYGQPFEWQAVTSVSGKDTDVCPEPGPDYLNPNRFRF